MKRSNLFFFAASLLILSSCASSPNPPDASAAAKSLSFSTNRIYIANVTPPSVTVVDLDTFNDKNPVVFPVYFKGIESKEQSHLISVSKDGKYIWLSEDISKTGGYVQVVDAQTFQIIKTWDLGAGVGTHISHDGRWGFFASERTNHLNINVFDVQNQRYLGYIEIGGSPHNFDTTQDGKFLYTTNFPKGDFFEFDISGLANIAAQASSDRLGEKLPITPKRTFNPGGTSAHGVLVHPNGKYAVVGSYTAGPNGSVVGAQAFDTIVDLSKAEITAVKKIPGGNHNFEISPDQKLFISSEWNAQDCNEETYLQNLQAFGNVHLSTPLLRYIDISTLNTANPDPESIKVTGYLDGKDLGYSALAPMSHQIYDPSGKYLFVTTIQMDHKNKGELVVLDGTSKAVLARIDLPTHPHGLALPGYGR